MKLSIQTRIRNRLKLLGFLVGLGNVLAADVSLSWHASDSIRVTGYNIYFGTSSSNYTCKIKVGNVTTTTISNLNCGTTYFFSATALDSRGNESGFSNETRFLVPGMLTLNAVGNVLVSAPPVAVPAIAGRASVKAAPGPVAAEAKPGIPLVIKFPVAPSHWYQVQATVDFISWSTVWQTGVTTSNAWVQFSHTNSSAYPSRYYRLVLH